MAGLNAAETAAAVALLRDLRSMHALALLIVEHIMDVIMGVCDRVLVLNSGEKIADGGPGLRPPSLWLRPISSSHGRVNGCAAPIDASSSSAPRLSVLG
jgi:energy-coupling factor transporter ATP-binding protein EcfA2